MPIEEGFRGQRLVVVPRPVVSDALTKPVTRRLLVTDVGYYPDALDHQMSRPRGTDETIVMVCASGTGWARIGETAHRVGSQQAIVIPRGVPHAYGSDQNHPWTIWWAHIIGADVADLLEGMEVTASRPLLRVRAIERAVALLDEILSNLERDQTPARLMAASGSAWKLLTQLAVDRTLPAPGDPLQRAMNFLSDRLDGSVRVPELARLVGVSPTYLTTMFRRATGGGVLAHHTALRMARARQLLDTTEATIAEIASEVGYDDPFYFSRHFRRHHGVSPSSFRTRNS
ncbi:helix-turn-helix domain-containing protein [Microbacterium maritypicum]|uniref:helix-turn-helix domain-containing protein n=1 Tax=Microbacterium maritypicum TaxID=33918 RepID=UPI0038230B1E